MCVAWPLLLVPPLPQRSLNTVLSEVRKLRLRGDFDGLFRWWQSPGSSSACPYLWRVPTKGHLQEGSRALVPQ